MINQIAPIFSVTARTSSFNKDLVKARHIQARLKDLQSGVDTPKSGILSDPTMIAPYVVPILRWIE
jgi:hypothetical protein